MIDTHHKVIDFGKHKGELWTRVPVSYLSWLANQQGSGENVEIARAEIQRRGSVYPQIDISGHAIDRASLSCRKIWHENRGQDEGLHAWLQRISMEAREKGQLIDGKYRYLGMKFVFEEGEYYPSLKTVMRSKR